MIVLSDLSNGPSLLRLRLHFDGSCVIYCFNSFSTSSSFISFGIAPQQSRLKHNLPEVSHGQAAVAEERHAEFYALSVIWLRNVFRQKPYCCVPPKLFF